MSHASQDRENKLGLRPSIAPSLTGIRGYAALWVCFYHIIAVSQATHSGMTPRLSRIINPGYLAVDLFLLLSGFVLMNAHGNDFRRITVNGTLAFYRARLIRVYPVSVVTLLIVATLVLVDQPFADFYRGLDPGNLTLPAFLATLTLSTRLLPIDGSWNEPIWSLSVEMLGYLLFPILALVLGRVRSATASLALALALLLALLVEQAHAGGLAKNYYENPGALFRLAACFPAGMALRVAADRGRAILEKVAVALSILTGAAIVALPFVAQAHVNIGVIAFAGLILALFFEKGPVARFLGARVSIFLGKISFPLYLLHAMMIWAFFVTARTVGGGQRMYLVGLPILVSFILVLAYLIHRFVELPFHRLARRRRDVDLEGKTA